MVQGSLQPPGGGNGVAAWIVQALRGRCELTVLTATALDLDAVNRHFGTTLAAEDLTAVTVRRPLCWRLIDRLPLRLSLLKAMLLTRQARKLAPAFDSVVGAAGETDLGVATVQYVHFPWSYLPRPPQDLVRPFHVGWLIWLYNWGCVVLTGFSFARMRRNLTLVNSQFTARHFAARHGVESEVLHPPTIGTFPDVAWSDRADAFICIGRISPEKELAKVIAVLAAVRERGRPVTLTIVGVADDPAYLDFIRGLAAAHAAWVRLCEDLPRAELCRLIAGHRYGIHGMQREHYGMAVAEMVRAGCIVFVPRQGGPAEIVGEEDLLLYDDVPDAVEKILRVTRDAELQAALRRRLALRGRELSTEHFVARIREVCGAA
jgi:glycosyltransferase involved in cell wall biosynthesis